jgi:hypothetical protein
MNKLIKTNIGKNPQNGNSYSSEKVKFLFTQRPFPQMAMEYNMSSILKYIFMFIKFHILKKLYNFTNVI